MNLEKVSKLSPCRDAMAWMKTQESPEAAWQNCERGDWMLWIAKKLGVDDRKLTMAKYHCAAQVLHLMKDQRSLDAMAASLKYAEGLISRKELDAAYAAHAAADAAHAADAADAAYAAADAAADAAHVAYAAYAAADAAADAAHAAHVAYAAHAAAADAAHAADAAADARSISLKKSADICRQYLTEEVFIHFNKL